MWNSVRNLLSYAWANLVAALGTTTLNILLFSFAIPIVIFLVMLAINWRAARRAGESVKQAIKGPLLSWPTIVPSLIYLLAWAGLLTWSVSTTAYRDHQALLARIRQLKSERDTAGKERDALKRQLTDKDAVVAELRKRSGRPPSSQSVPSTASQQPALPPPIQNIRVVSQDWVPSVNPSFKYQLKAVVQTNVAIQPVSIVFECDHDIGEGSVWFAGDTGEMFTKVRSGVLIANHKMYLASFESPAFTPEKNMVLTLFSNDPIKIVRFGQVPFRF